MPTNYRSTIQFPNDTEGDLSDSNTGKIRYNSAQQQMEVSVNGGAFAALGGGSGGMPIGRFGFGGSGGVGTNAAAGGGGASGQYGGGGSGGGGGTAGGGRGGRGGDGIVTIVAW